MSEYSKATMRSTIALFVKSIARRHRTNTIYDSSILPAPRETIIEYCLLRLKAEKNGIIRRNIADALLCIPFYQDGIGTPPMVDCRFDLFTMDLSSLDERQLGKVRLAIAEHLPHLDARRFLAVLTRVQAEFRQINELCEEIEREHAARETAAPPSA